MFHHDVNIHLQSRGKYIVTWFDIQEHTMALFEMCQNVSNFYKTKQYMRYIGKGKTQQGVLSMTVMDDV